MTRPLAIAATAITAVAGVVYVTGLGGGLSQNSSASASPEASPKPAAPEPEVPYTDDEVINAKLKEMCAASKKECEGHGTNSEADPLGLIRDQRVALLETSGCHAARIEWRCFPLVNDREGRSGRFEEKRPAKPLVCDRSAHDGGMSHRPQHR
jgi:hypothetical protein